MLIIASANGAVGIDAAMRVLKNGGSAIDAAEAGIRLVEADPGERSVGYNGYPNIVGQLELDASIMDGGTLNSGAVAIMRGFPYAISVARQVMDRKLPHVMLAGEGAERFAREIGAEQWASMLSEEVKALWRERLIENSALLDIDAIDEDSPLLDAVTMATDPERVTGTVNFIAIDGKGDMCSGVSTSGWAWKYPGRVGDSPIIGAGNYADNRHGACACTGMGEMAIRACTAYGLVSYLRAGLPIQAAGQKAMEDLRDLDGDFIGGMNLITLDREGNHVGLTTRAGSTYIYQHAEMDAHREKEREFVAIPARWAGEARA
ncbi:MAG: N(4)-(beta-N-acetylglucosaminyl)-L-asparaginase [Chloroflexi bacterium]|nr:N(4)-(beta-N-acetylglucosaminyl)-L-asparaginase [Chloroflexota bacterium]